MMENLFFLDFGAISEGIALPREIMEIINTLILPLLLIKKIRREGLIYIWKNMKLQ